MSSKHKDMVDMIGNLPDPILHLILCGLPTTEEVIRTSILSKRWRYMWTSVPSIDIDYFRGLKPRKEFKKKKFEEFVCRVLANKSIDLDSFRLHCWSHYNMSTVGRWIEAAVRRKVKLLDLKFCTEDEYDVIELPHCLVTCGSLEVLKLSLFAYRLSLPKITGFPALRVLELNGCNLMNDDIVKDFLKSCPLLEDLSLIDCETCNFHLLCISCPKLKNLRIDSRGLQDWADGEFSIEGMCHRLQICCPNLVFMEFKGFMANKFIFESIDSLEKAVIHPQDTFPWEGSEVCELFAGISHVESLSLRMCFIEKAGFNLKDFPEDLPNLTTLELTTTIEVDSMNVLIQILTRSPDLQSLHINIEEGKSYSSSKPEVPDFGSLEVECAFEELTMVKVTGISAVPHHLGFIEFMLESSPVLETMSITPSVNMTDGRSSILTSVLKFPRASPEAEIVFV